MSEPTLVWRRMIVAGLRNGTVPRRSLELFAVGLERFDKALDEEMQSTALGHGVSKTVRSEYGTGQTYVSDGFLTWLMGQPNVGVAVKNRAGIKGELDHFGAAGFLRGLLAVLAQTGRKGLLLVLYEVETIQRVRSDVREKSLNALR